MSYIDQKNAFLRKQKNLTPREIELVGKAWEDGYLTSTVNWCQGKR